MLKIIMGSERVKEFTDQKFIEFPNSYFNYTKKASWFKDKLVKEIIEQIDRATVELDFAVKSLDYNTGYSVDTISGGSKALILIHKIRDKIFLATMGDNCTDFLEKIALDYEKEGKDLLIVENYLHRFKFNYIKDIYYVNWGITCHNEIDIAYKISPLWTQQEREDMEPYDDEEYN